MSSNGESVERWTWSLANGRDEAQTMREAKMRLAKRLDTLAGVKIDGLEIATTSNLKYPSGRPRRPRSRKLFLLAMVLFLSWGKCSRITVKSDKESLISGNLVSIDEGRNSKYRAKKEEHNAVLGTKRCDGEVLTA